MALKRRRKTFTIMSASCMLGGTVIGGLSLQLVVDLDFFLPSMILAVLGATMLAMCLSNIDWELTPDHTSRRPWIFGMLRRY